MQGIKVKPLLPFLSSPQPVQACLRQNDTIITAFFHLPQTAVHIAPDVLADNRIPEPGGLGLPPYAAGTDYKRGIPRLPAASAPSRCPCTAGILKEKRESGPFGHHQHIPHISPGQNCRNDQPLRQGHGQILGGMYRQVDPVLQ